MSEKRVNIRITASTSDFDKAIKKAQNQIEKLTKTIEDLGDGKFGNKLEQQLEKAADSAEKMQKSLEKMQDSLDDVNKSKMDKLEDGLDDAADSAKDLNEELEDTKDSLDDLNKSKMNNFEKQFEDAKKATETLEEKLDDVIDSLKEIDDIDIDRAKRSFEDMKESSQDLGKRIDDLLDNFDKLDSQDLNRLRSEFEQIQSTIKELDDDFEKAVGELDEEIQEAADEIGLFDRAIEDIDVDKFIKLEESIMDLDKYIDEVYQSMQDFSRENNSLETDKIEDYANAMEKLSNTNANLNLDSNIKNKSNKGSNSGNNSDRLSNAVTELAGAELISNRVTSAIQDLEGSIDKVADSMRDMNAPVQETVKNYQDMVNDLIKTQEEVDAAEKEYKQLTDELKKNNEEIDDYKQTIASANQTLDTYTEMQIKMENMHAQVTKSIKKYESALSDAKKDVETYTKALEEMQEAGKKIDDSFDINNLEQMNDALKELDAGVLSLRYNLSNKGVNNFSEIAESLRDLSPVTADAADALKNLFYNMGSGDYDKWISEINKQMKEFAGVAREEFGAVPEILEEVRTRFREVNNLAREYTQSNKKSKALHDILDQADAVDKLAEAREKLNNLQSDDSVKEYQDNLKKVAELEKRIIDLAEKRFDITEKNQWDTNSLIAYNNEVKKLTKAADELKEKLQEAQNVMDKGNNKINESTDEFNEQYKAYEKLSQRVKEYLEDESNAIVLREKVAKSFRDVADAMEKVYSGSSKHNNADLINKTLEESVKHFKELNVISTDNLQRDLNRLGEIIEDKTEKIKRFKEYNKEFGTDASKASYGIEKQGEALKDYADSIAFVINKTNVLQKAWGDISVGDVDHLQIRPRIELLDNYEKKLKSAADEIKEFYTEKQGPMTQKQQTTLEDWKIWEKNADKLKEYNKALEEYFTTIMDSGGNIDARFLDELGKFDVAKFAKEFEKMGTTSVVLQKQFNANKIALQEWLQTEKEYREEAVKSAKVALDQATNNQKLAESYEERREATEKIAKAEEELAKAKESLKNFIPDASKEIQKLNEIAEGLRKIGMAAEDLGKEDIAKFDKSLASLLDRMDTFDNDLPKTFSDLKEDIKAVFADMDGLDFGSVFDGLKDIGAGLLDKIPGKAKIAAAAIAGIGKAMKEVADIGVNQFYKGMDTVQNALSGFINVARDIGQEVVSAFENITGFDMDFSSLIEVPIEFEAQMKRVGAIAGVVGEEFDKLEEKARTLGATTPFSASEVAEAMEYMGQAGWGYQEIMDGIEGVLSLSTIAEMELGKAAEFVTDAINTFPDMEVKDAAHLVDVLAKVSVSSSTSVAQMQRAFTNCAPVAGTLGISVEDLSMALGLMANQGVKGAKAGTALKNLMTNMSAPTQKQLDFMKEFNLEGAQQKIVTGDLIGGIKDFKAAIAGLSAKQQNAIISTIAGKEALSGVSALLNTTEADLAALEKELASCTGAAGEMSKEFEQTLKGSLNNLAGALEETTLQIFDKMEKGVAGVINQLTTFVNIINGIEQSASGLTGIAGAMEYLEETTRGWGDAIATGLSNAIASLNDFINGGALDNLLQAGTNIINGIADGIRNAAENGTLQSAITGAIQKIGTWFSENLETVVEVGKIIIDAISQGISDNGDLIGEIINQVIDMQTTIDSTIAYEKARLFGENLGSFIGKGMMTKLNEWSSTLSGFFSGLFGGGATTYSSGFTISDSVTGAGQWYNTSKTAKKNDTSKVTTKNNKKTVTDEVADQMNKGKVKTDKAASEIGKGISDNILKKLETMDAGDLKELNQEMKNLQGTVKSMSDGIGKSFGLIRESARTEIVGMTNIFRNQFVNMTNITRNQMINVSNIIRNQAVNWANIIRNQVTNGRNAFTQQMMSMAAVARTQMVNVSNIIRNQAINWYNIINNQAKKARDAFTSQMISMAKVASTQMGKVSSSIRNAMKTSASASAMSYSVNRTVSVNYAGLSANALYAANNASTATLGNNMGALANSASYAMSTGGGSMAGSSIGSNITLEIPVCIDGKVAGKAMARYVDNELKTMNKRENRKRGAK